MESDRNDGIPVSVNTEQEIANIDDENRLQRQTVPLHSADSRESDDEVERAQPSTSEDINSISNFEVPIQTVSGAASGNAEEANKLLSSELPSTSNFAEGGKTDKKKEEKKPILRNGSAVFLSDDKGKEDDTVSLPPYLQSGKEYFDYIHRYMPGSTLQHGIRSHLQRILRRYAFLSINIAVFGFPNSGKSAFINTARYAASLNPESSYEEACGERKVDCTDATSLTNKRQYVGITEEIGLVDNKGMEDFTSITMHEISRQCEGYRGKDDFIPDSWNQGITTKVKDYLKYWCTGKVTRLQDRVHCPIIIYSLVSENEPETLAPLIQLFQRTCGSPPVIVMTHYDKVKEDDELLQDRKRRFQNLHCARMYCIENYTHTKHKRKEETDKIVAEIISACCLVSDQYLVETLLRSNSSKCC